MNKFKTFFALAVCLSFTTLTHAGNVEAVIELNPTGSFVAKTDKVSGKIVKNNGEFTAEKISIKVKTLSTDMDLRDQHLKEKLQSEQFKTIEVTNAKGANGKGSGTITIKGITKEIQFTYQEESSKINAEFSISLKDFKIEGISYMGIGVEDKVKIKAALDL